MSDALININDILVEKSRFSTTGFVFESNFNEVSLEDSLRHLGILHPVIIYRDRDERFHLIDGRKRIQFARQRRTEKISAVVLPESTPVTDIITLILSGKRQDIEHSVINKILFICFARAVKARESWILNSLCIQFGFRPYSEFLKDCERINVLPEEIKLFCHEKKFSMKQTLNLSHYPGDILLQLMQWRMDIQLTASIMDELASNLKDHLRAEKQTLGDFISKNTVQEIIRSSMPPRDKTERLRKLIYTKRFPVLSEINAKIEEKVAQLNLPESISVSWDKNLENRNVEITVHVNDNGQLTTLLDTLSSDEIKKAIDEVLDEL